MSDGVTITPSGIDKKVKDIEKKVQRDIPLAIAKAITRTAMQAKRDTINKMKVVFDRPTPYTLRSVYVDMATPEKQVARIYIKDRGEIGVAQPWHYLKPQIFGGSRSQKRFERLLVDAGIIKANEYLVPWKAKKDRYGNVSQGTIQKVLSGLQAQFDANQWSPSRGKGYGGTRRNRTVPRRYFTMKYKGRTIICEREMRENKAGARSYNHFTPLFVTTTSLQYKKRFPFFETVRSTIKSKLRAELNAALRKEFKKKVK